MEDFKENYSTILLSKEWLVRVDNSNSIPYLFKFGFSEDKEKCFILVTDTKAVWAEVLTRNQFFRRWHKCNPAFPLQNNHEAFSQLQTLIQDVHTAGAISDATFEIVESRDADLAFEIDCDDLKWCWDTYLLGPKTSADVISRHLIMPLISVVHISFYSADPVSELEESDLEKTVDRIGRTARRSLDIHVKHTISRPRIATILQRISSLLGLVPSLPSIKSEAQTPDLGGKLATLRAHIRPLNETPPPPVAPISGNTFPQDATNNKSPSSISIKRVEPTIVSVDVDSATESDVEEVSLPRTTNAEVHVSSSTTSAPSAGSTSRVSETPISRATSRAQDLDLGSESPPAKRLKTKIQAISDSDSEPDSGAGRRSQTPQGTAIEAGRAGRRYRQPIKRAGRRF